jgi:hypothetical protein
LFETNEGRLDWLQREHEMKKLLWIIMFVLIIWIIIVFWTIILLFLCKQIILFEFLYVQIRICMNNDLFERLYVQTRILIIWNVAYGMYLLCLCLQRPWKNW